MSAGESAAAAADGGARHPGHHRPQGTPARLLQRGVVPLLVHDVQGAVEERPPAGAGHGKFVDGGVGVTLSVQLGLRYAASPAHGQKSTRGSAVIFKFTCCGSSRFLHCR